MPRYINDTNFEVLRTSRNIDKDQFVILIQSIMYFSRILFEVVGFVVGFGEAMVSVSVSFRVSLILKKGVRTSYMPTYHGACKCN